MKSICKNLFWVLSFLLLPIIAGAQQTVTVPIEIAAYPDLIVYNGKIVTMDDKSFGLNTPMGTVGEAMSIRDGKIQAVGTNTRILGLAGPKTEKIDLKGRMVMPGIVDTHTHIHNNELNYWESQNPAAVTDFRKDYVVMGKTDAELEQGVRNTIQEHVAKASTDQWAYIVVGSGNGSGQGLGVGFLRRKALTRQVLDKIVPDHPVILYSHPSYVINSAGIRAIEKLYGSKMSLQAAGIHEDGMIQVVGPAYIRGLIVDQYFDTRVGQLADIVEEGLAKNAAVGITTYISHIQGQRFLDAFNVLNRQNRMPIRFAYLHMFGAYFGYPDGPGFYRRMGDMAGMGTDYFWLAATRPGGTDSGPPQICTTMEAPKALKEMEACDNAPGQSNIYEITRSATANYHRVIPAHAYGDKGVDYYMDAIEGAMQDNPAITYEYIRSRRLISDHCGFYPRKDQIPRMAKLGMMISCGGNVISRSYNWIGPGKYAPKYIEQIAPIRSAIAGGVIPAVENEAGVQGNLSQTYFRLARPFLTRKSEQGATVGADEAIDRVTLMKMMTSWASLFTLKEKVLGTLEPGKFADFLVLNKDYFTASMEEFGDIIPLMTVVGGKVIVLREEFARELGRSPVGPQLKFVDMMKYAPSGG